MIKGKRVIIGVTAAAVAAGLSAALIARAVRKRRKRLLSNKIRKSMTSLLQLRSEDFLAEDGIGQSLFMKRVSSLDTKHLIALFALVQVGHFVRTEHIDPLHLTSDELRRAASHYIASELAAPETRAALLGRLQSEGAGNLKDALTNGLAVMTRA